MQEKMIKNSPDVGDSSQSDYFYNMQRELCSILGEIKRNGTPQFIEKCLKDCDEILSTRNNVFGDEN